MLFVFSNCSIDSFESVWSVSWSPVILTFLIISWLTFIGWSIVEAVPHRVSTFKKWYTVHMLRISYKTWSYKYKNDINVYHLGKFVLQKFPIFQVLSLNLIKNSLDFITPVEKRHSISIFREHFNAIYVTLLRTLAAANLRTIYVNLWNNCLMFNMKIHVWDLHILINLWTQHHSQYYMAGNRARSWVPVSDRCPSFLDDCWNISLLSPY